MEKIRIQNLKSIKDSGFVDIKPLTILIGKNSSGKSSFVRTFPLIKQSFLKKLSSPILWYGDYVDFGSFNNSLCETHDKDDNYISTTFLFRVNPVRMGFLNTKSTSVEFTIKITKEHIKEYKFIFEGHSLSLVLDSKKEDYLTYIDETLYEKEVLFKNRGRLFPESERRSMGYLYFDFLIPETLIGGARINRYELFQSLQEKVLNYSYIFDDDKLYEISTQMLKKLMTSKNIQEKVLEYTKDLAFNLKISLVIDFITSTFYNFEREFDKVSYFQPIRSRGDRIYRVQGFNVDEVDSDGVNAPMVLYFMTRDRRKKFGEWCQKLFGFKYDIAGFGDKSESMSVVVVDTEKGVKHNLTDVGFGYSQVLPIILSLWIHTEKKSGTRERHVIVLEQPELHLHPGFQKRMIKTIISIINEAAKAKMDIKFIIETHSESIINYVCKNIADNGINESYVNLLVFKKENRETKIEKMRFDNDGTITNWPIGFFSEED